MIEHIISFEWLDFDVILNVVYLAFIFFIGYGSVHGLIKLIDFCIAKANKHKSTTSDN